MTSIATDPTDLKKDLKKTTEDSSVTSLVQKFANVSMENKKYRFTNRVRQNLNGVAKKLPTFGKGFGYDLACCKVDNGSTVFDDSMSLIVSFLMLLLNTDKETVLKSEEQVRRYVTWYEPEFTVCCSIIETSKDGSVKKRLTVTRCYQTNMDEELEEFSRLNVLTMTIRQKKRLVIDFYITKPSHLICLIHTFTSVYRDGCGLFDLANNNEQNARWSTTDFFRPSPVFTMRPFIRQFYDDEAAQRVWNLNVGSSPHSNLLVLRNVNK